MTEKLQHQYIAWGILSSLLIFHWTWCQFVAYPIAFEKQLKRGKPWVYIPIRWKGFYKFQIRVLSKFIMLGVVGAGVLLVNLYTNYSSAPVYIAYGMALGALVIRLDSYWQQVRYRQQEDSYYYIHDELRTKLEGEGKDMGEAAFKSLAAYQHQNLLRKADQQGQLLKILREQAKASHQFRKSLPVREVVET